MSGVIDYDMAVYTFAAFGVLVLSRFIWRELRRRRRRRERTVQEWWNQR